MKQKRVQLTKEDGEENKADLGTKYTTTKVQNYLMSKLPLTFLKFARKVVPLNADRELEEAQDRTIVSLAALKGLLMCVVVILCVLGGCSWWQNRKLKKEVENLKKEQERLKQSLKEKEDEQQESTSGASSSGIQRGHHGITHLPGSASCQECVLPVKRPTNRRPVVFDDNQVDPTISSDEHFPSTTSCPDCGERVNIWRVKDNSNGNQGRQYCKCSQKHFNWCDTVNWEYGRKVIMKKRNL